MTRQNISVGAAANDGTGDTLRQAGTKINENFVEIYQRFGGDSDILMPGISFDSNGIIFEGSSVDAFETTLVVEDPTADRTVTIPNYTGQIVIDSDTQTLSNKTILTPTLTTPKIKDTDSSHTYNIVVSNLAANRNVTLPLLTGNDEFVFKDHTVTMTNKTLTTPTVYAPIIQGHIDDSDGNIIIDLSRTSSAVNNITIQNSATGTGPSITSTGTDTNVDLNVNGKGTGAVRLQKTAFVSAVQNSDTAVTDGRTFTIFNKATALAATMADGTVTGEVKYFVNKNAGTATVTPTSFAQGTSFSIAQNGAAQCIWDGTNWYLVGFGDSDASTTYITVD